MRKGTPIIISNNCVAGHIDNILHRSHVSPFAWHFLAPQDMITLYENFDKLNLRNIEFGSYTDWRKENPNPLYKWYLTEDVPNEDERVAVLIDDKVWIVYPHHNINAKEQFVEGYNRRIDRFDAIENKHLYFVYQTYKGEPKEMLYKFLTLEGDKILIDNQYKVKSRADLKVFDAENIYKIYNPKQPLNSAYNKKFVDYIKSL